MRAVEVVVEHQRRGTLDVARVINCTGPACDYARLDLPLVVQMRRAGWLVPDPLRLGIETADDGRLIGADGQPVDDLYTLGPLRRPAFWESTAIPEIRQQADGTGEGADGALGVPQSAEAAAYRAAIRVVCNATHRSISDQDAMGLAGAPGLRHVSRRKPKAHPDRGVLRIDAAISRADRQRRLHERLVRRRDVLGA